MAQWQRVGFQTQRLGVRIPLASFLFLLLLGSSKANMRIFREKKKKKKVLPTLGIAPRLPRPQRGVLLLDYDGAAASGGSGYRSRFSTLRRLYATMYNNPPKQSCVHRDSNPNLILGRDKYYPCTMDARVLETQRPPCVRTTAVWAPKRGKKNPGGEI